MEPQNPAASGHRRYKYHYEKTANYEMKSIEFHGGLENKPDDYKNPNVPGHEIRFFTNGLILSGKVANVVISKCVTSGSTFFEVQSDRPLTMSTENESSLKVWTYPEVDENNPLNNVLRVQVADNSSVREILYTVADPEFDYYDGAPDEETSQITFQRNS